MIQFIKCSSIDAIKEIQHLAEVIWNEHYLSIIGQSQIDYMLLHFQSEAAISDQIKNGIEYYLIQFNGQNVGYFSYEVKSDHLFLSKLYVLKNQRGAGIAAKCLNYLKETIVSLHLKFIKLTVNKNNTVAIGFYHKIGFITIEEVIQNIGEGYFMDDYVLKLDV